jgi:hypothetical protein
VSAKYDFLWRHRCEENVRHSGPEAHSIYTSGRERTSADSEAAVMSARIGHATDRNDVSAKHHHESSGGTRMITQRRRTISRYCLR